MSEPREIYVGYHDEAPPRLAAWLTLRVRAVVAGGAVLAGILAWDMRPFPPKAFEWGKERTFVGWLETSPAPSLLALRPGSGEVEEKWSRYLLVSPGKFGPPSGVNEYEGNPVELRGMLIHREDQAMIEIVPGSIRRAVGEAVGKRPPSAFETLGTHTFVGEIVDSKCFLGVMQPGEAKTHRACATRCIAGGVPPVFLVRREDGTALTMLLLAADGGVVNDAVLSFVAEPVEITGTVERHHDLLVLKADPSTYRRRT